ncbi:MAG: hypothetical protein OI74_05255 [Gammaproteobacteria bacterium (ex Lamellibrachia satsuma)]|nr:MAG: hypothetical protein HPY30_03000 [Gammaproteobacteria bacterium (ex Lamellibrachia satsuma)]RRS34614.1 MAG: hypothetical protein OI74_05255 [Gammaproteobacteria bacterium (ex Lamellibrachia satsuma)]RRS37394.1 MAG: hypothetical protein NV67_01050 [Gammaproteobacteria bacterium (ex Lamellibrachia satsuma)]
MLHLTWWAVSNPGMFAECFPLPFPESHVSGPSFSCVSILYHLHQILPLCSNNLLDAEVLAELIPF